MFTTRPFAVIAVLLLMSSTAPAQEDTDPDEAKKDPPSYWSTVFQGGMLTPLGKMTDVHQASLAGGGRIGWTSRHGLGVDLAAEYSPLSRKHDLGGEYYETHFVTASLMPRFTLGKKYLRMWVAAGGGLAYERQTLTDGMDATALGATTNRYAPAGVGAAGLEFHFLAGVGLAVIGSYTRTYGDFEYEILNVTGGLAFTFE